MMESGRILGGRYQIIERIGSGGMSTVYRAHEVGLEREVAIKVLIAALLDDPQLVERFTREAKTIANLQHPAIIPIYYYGIEDDFGSYLVMPLLKGGTLDQRLEQLSIRPSLTEVGELAQKLGSALQYAHDRGIVHRDIKFSNIMFDDAGSPYLMDFGIAKMLGATNLTGTGMTVGTPQFMPPEQWRNDEVTPAVDQYAFAVVIYAMLTQRMPFDAPTPHALMYQHLQEQPPLASSFRDDVPKAIEDALHRALSKEPDHRFPTVSQFTEAVAEAAFASTRQYSGFFNTPLPPVTGQTGVRTVSQKKSTMPDNPTEMVPDQAATTAAAEGQAAKPATQIKPQTVEPATGGINGPVFWGAMITVVIVGMLVIGFVYLQMQDSVGGTATPTTDVAEASQSAMTAAVQNVVDDTPTATRTPEPSATDTATVTLTPEPSATDTATATITSSPTATATRTPEPSSTATATQDATGTQLALAVTANAQRQATAEAALQQTGTALAQVATQQAINEATETQSAFFAINTAEANLASANTATTVAETMQAEQAMADATGTAFAAISTQQSVDIGGTATAFANLQATAIAQQTNIAATQTEAARQVPITPTVFVPPNIRTIQPGVVVTGNASGEEAVQFQFSGTANEVISIAARSADFDPVIELYFNGSLLISDDDGGYRTDARITDYRLMNTGTYILLIRDFAGSTFDGTYHTGITTLEDCPGVLPSRLLIGEYGRVTLTGGANRLRQNPSTRADILDTVPPGGVFEVLRGPTCADGFAWYQIEYDTLTGWTAEGDDTTYYLEAMPTDDEPVLITGGIGLTDGSELAPGEFQVEYYCSRRGLRTTTDEVNWYCVNRSDVRLLTLGQSDFDQICRDTYDLEDAFARQDGDASEPAFRWRCYYYPAVGD